MVHVGLGRKEEAIRLGERAVRMRPVSRNLFLNIGPVVTLAEIYVMVGEYDAAIDKLEYPQATGHACPLLELDPIWDPLRDHPRFQQLLEEYDTQR